MYVPERINIDDSLREYIHSKDEFKDFLNIPDNYEFDYGDYLSHYSYLSNYSSESVLYSVIEWFRSHYGKTNLSFGNLVLDNHLVSDLLRVEMVGKYVSVDCVVNKVSETAPEIVKATVKCRKCCEIYSFDVLNNSLELPAGVSCEGCGSTKYELQPEDCIYVDSQKIVVQELQEKTTHGQQPKTLLCRLKGNLTNTLIAGERVRLQGVVHIRYDGGLFSKIYLDVFALQKKEIDSGDIIVTGSDMIAIKELSSKDDLYDLLANSICPSVYGYIQLKKAMVFQMFGGSSINLEDGTHLRGDSHLLFVGDAGVAKSQMIRAVAQLIPRSVYTSGKSSSGVGLTAAVIKDDDGKYCVQAGALPMADGGIAVIDELDKMSVEDRSALHEALEQQTIHINKAGISTQLYARCSLLAAANPMTGRFSLDIPLEDQVDLPPSLFTRFDLVFLMVDEPNADTDMLVARHILKTRRNAECIASGILPNDDTGVSKPISTDLLRKYIVVAKKVNPIMTNEVIDMLTEEYVQMRVNNETHKRISPRQLEALIRLSEASARIRLSETITQDDVQRAVSLYVTSNSSIDIADKGEESLWKTDSIYVSLVPADGILLLDYVNEVMRRTLFTDEQEVTNILMGLVANKRLMIKRIGNQSFVCRC